MRFANLLFPCFVIYMFIINILNEVFQVQEWLYTDGEDASATQFQEHLDKLKAIGDPIFFRSAPSIN